uniref:Aldo/keto reductase n=1 Tax=uncultured marine thaumarchaeote KM3_193_A03 TaxID=1456081 RepID=A0A075GXG7_9ARCH|nr:aldo/keto reductase [uncultured marine thaumarchaeote KM3_193_A03]
MNTGYATPEGTKKFAERQHVTSQKNYKNIHNLTLSNVGIGTYLGNPDTETDYLVQDAVKKSILGGVNVIDSAINYRAQKAERSVGNAISQLIDNNDISREEIFVSTKNGYVTNDGDIEEDLMQYVIREYGKTGIVKEGDISPGYHCMTIPYLNDQLERSLKNLGLDCIDLMYLHNSVEGQAHLPREQFLKNLKDVFDFYEKKRKGGKIRFYGMATWECFRTTPENPLFLQLSEVMDLAVQAGGKEHGFRFIQLPFNLMLDQAYITKNHNVDGKTVSVLEAAQEFNLGVFTSVPLMQGKLLATNAIPEFGNFSTSVRLLQFVRSTPGITAPLIGHKLESHVEENMNVMKISPLSELEFNDLVKRMVK